MEDLVVSTNKKVMLEKFMSQVKVATPNSVKKVINVSVLSGISSCEISSGMVTLSGKLMLDVLYENTENVLEKASAEADFIEKQRLDLPLADLFAKDEVLLSNVDFSSSEIICSVTHNTEIIGVLGKKLASFEEEAGLVQNKTNFALSKLSSSTGDNFLVAEENETNLKDIQILSLEPKVVIDEALASVDKVVLEGKVVFDVLYLDGLNIGSLQKQVDFRQEIAAEGVTPSMKAVSYACTTSANATLEESEKTTLSLNANIAAKVYVFDEQTIEVSTDVFMLSNDVAVAYDLVECKKHLETTEQSDSVLSQTDITQIADFDDLVGVYFPKISVISIENSGDKAVVNAEIWAVAIYKTADDYDKIEIKTNAGFEVLKQPETIVDDAFLNCEIVSAKVKAGKEIEVAFKCACHANIAANSSEMVVKSFEIQDAKPVDLAGIKVYVTRDNQTIFDVAKALNVRPEIISAQNEVDDTFESGQKVYVYSPINFS